MFFSVLCVHLNIWRNQYMSRGAKKHNFIYWIYALMYIFRVHSILIDIDNTYYFHRHLTNCFHLLLARNSVRFSSWQIILYLHRSSTTHPIHSISIATSAQYISWLNTIHSWTRCWWTMSIEQPTKTYKRWSRENDKLYRFCFLFFQHQ